MSSADTPAVRSRVRLRRRAGRVRNAAAPGDTRLLWPWEGFDPAPTDGVVEHATWIGDPDRPLFAWLTLPASGQARGGVVLCQPMGEEARSAHRTFRRLGIELARRGLACLRVDYDGTGDSAGAQRDADRLQAWRDSVTTGARFLRASGLEHVSLSGMRLGATLAADVAAATEEFDTLVLWDPCATGRAFLREGAALHNLGDYRTQHRADGGTDTPGFTYEPETVEELAGLALSALSSSPRSRPTLVLLRDELALAPRIRKAVDGPDVEWADAVGQEDLIGVEPNQARSPLTTIARIAEWLDAHTPAPAVATTPALVADAVVTDPGSGVAVRERIVRLGPDRLFGIVTEPLEPRPTAPWVLMVNVAIEIHIGPGRRWVDFARSWAAMGLRCVRFDQSGLGDSPVRAGQREDVMFDAHWLDDLPNVVDALDVGDAPVAGFGLCSGAYSAFEAAMRRPFHALYALSVRLTTAEMAPGQIAHDRRRIAARPFIRPLGHLFQRDTRVAWGLWRVYQQFAFWHAPMSSVLAVLRRGCTVRVVCDVKDAEGFREVLWWAWVRRRAVARTKRYSLRVIPELDHALMTQHSQLEAYQDATRFWFELYGDQLSTDVAAATAHTLETPRATDDARLDEEFDEISRHRYAQRR